MILIAPAWVNLIPRKCRNYIQTHTQIFFFFGRLSWFLWILGSFSSHYCIALRSRTAKNTDWSTCPLARLLAPLTVLLSPPCSLRSRAPLYSLACSLTHLAHSRARGTVNGSMAFFCVFSILDHSASKRANGCASGPVLQSGFLVILDHSAQYSGRQKENVRKVTIYWRRITAGDKVITEPNWGKKRKKLGHVGVWQLHSSGKEGGKRG